jgi:hypothetical protein
MKNKKFKLSHLFLSITCLLVFQGIIFKSFPMVATDLGLILFFGVVGTGMNIYVAIEAIKEVRASLYMIIFLWLIVLEFIVFFSFEYWFLILVQPTSFPLLHADVMSILLHSTMVFVFNPYDLPATFAGRGLLLINTLGALGLVLFILQNIWQLRPHNHTS